jgi:Tfp pilus assembly protein PilO
MVLGLRGLLILLIVVGMPVASFYLVFKPQNAEITSAQQEIEHKEALLVKLQEETSRNEDLERANEEIQRSIKLIEARLPSNKEVDALVRQVSELAISCGLQAPGMRSLRPVPAALFMEQPIEIEVAGSFGGFHAFIASLEKLPRITRIHDLKLTAADDREEVELKAQFTLSIYFQDETNLAQGSTP